jgi:hypothetical protein
MRIRIHPGIASIKTLLISFLLLVSLIASSCQIDPDQLPFVSSSNNKFAAFMVPDTNLDLYVYAKQEHPTVVPAEMIKMPRDVDVETLAIWGVPAKEGLVLGMAFTFADPQTASDTYSRITLDQNWWKFLNNNVIYIVQGSGIASKALKDVISSNDFKYYDDSKILESVLIFPNSGRSKIIALAAAKPSEQVMNYLEKNIDNKNVQLVNKISKQINLDFIIAGLYSPHQMNIAKAGEVLKKGTNVSSLDLGALLLIKSNLPGFLVEPAVKSILTEYGFTEKILGRFSLYRGLWSTVNNNVVPIFIRIEDNYIFVSLSGQETYAETLITSVYK